MTSTVLRGIAVLIAASAIIDPGFARTRRVPLPVDIAVSPASSPDHGAAVAAARDLEAAVREAATTASPEPVQARVVIGEAAPVGDGRLPTFVLQSVDASGGVRVQSIDVGGAAVPGQSVRVRATVRGLGVRGHRSALALRERGVVVATREHEWTSAEEVVEFEFGFVPSAPGVHRVTLEVATPGRTDARVDATVRVTDRRLRVLVYEPRPTWAAAFVRRPLERDPAFEVSAISRSAPRVRTQLHAAPESLSAMDPDAHDVVVVGAPDALSTADLAALDRFTAVRGGALLLLPDSRLSRQVEAHFGLPRTEERLLETAADIVGAEWSIRGSELLVAQRAPGAYTTLAALSGDGAPVIVAVPRGDGHVVLSGVLDGWRQRAAEGVRHDAFWRGFVASLALAAQPRLSVTVDPAIARPGERVRVRAAWRPDVLRSSSSSIDVPVIAAETINPGGKQETIRLWPGERAGIYEGWLEAGGVGTHVISVQGEGASADAVLRVDGEVLSPSAGELARAQTVAADVSGGAVVHSIPELVERLARVPRREVEWTQYPMRSPFWMLPFAGCLCAEWLIRRKRGQR